MGGTSGGGSDRVLVSTHAHTVQYNIYMRVHTAAYNIILYIYSVCVCDTRLGPIESETTGSRRAAKTVGTKHTACVCVLYVVCSGCACPTKLFGYFILYFFFRPSVRSRPTEVTTGNAFGP